MNPAAYVMLVQELLLHDREPERVVHGSFRQPVQKCEEHVAEAEEGEKYVDAVACVRQHDRARPFFIPSPLRCVSVFPRGRHAADALDKPQFRVH